MATVRSTMVRFLVLAAIAGGLLSGATSGAAQPIVGEPLDLSAIHLYPDDLAVAGFLGYGIYGSGTRFPDQWAAEIAFDSNLPLDQVQASFDGWGVLRYQRLTLADLPSDGPGLGRKITTYVIEFGAAAGADEAFPSFERLYAREPMSGARPFGEESAASRESATDPETGAPLNVLALTFRADRLILGVAIEDLTGGWPLLPQLEALAARLESRTADVVAGDAPGLYRYGLFLVDPLVTSHNDFYALTGGATIPHFQEDAAKLAARTAYYGAAIDAHYAQSRVSAGAASTGDDIYVMSEVIRFADAVAASAWFEGLTERVAACCEGEHVEVAAPTLGDQASAMTIVRLGGRGEFGDWHERRIHVRVGAMVVTARIANVRPVAAAPVEALAAAAVACLNAGGCADRVPLPAGLVESGQVVPEAARSGTLGEANEPQDWVFKPLT